MEQGRGRAARFPADIGEQLADLKSCRISDLITMVRGDGKAGR